MFMINVKLDSNLAPSNASAIVECHPSGASESVSNKVLYGHVYNKCHIHAPKCSLVILQRQKLLTKEYALAHFNLFTEKLYEQNDRCSPAVKAEPS